MKMYSYLVEGLPNGQWRWTVFGDGTVTLIGNLQAK
jgi:hypothetical protein